MANYIDKDKLIKELSVIQNRPVHTATKIIQELPNEEVQPIVHAYWKVTDTLIGKCCTCSNCGSCPTMEYRFCPYCGAKMDGKEE